VPQQSGSAECTYGDVVDLARYPIDDLDSRQGQALVRTCRDELEEKGACSLAGFLTPAAIDAMVRLATSLAGQAWVSDQTHTVYFEPVDQTVGPSHPRAHQVRSAKRGIAYDYIPRDAPVRRLYESDDMTRFVAAVLDKVVLYRSADPLDALQITLFQEADELGWHFDRSEFSVTLMYQQSEEGGHFEYVPGLRSDEDQTCPQVQQVLQGDIGAARLPGNPGTGPVPRPTRPPPSYPDQRTTSQNQLRPHLRRAA
jgi:hypothetical protein